MLSASIKFPPVRVNELSESFRSGLLTSVINSTASEEALTVSENVRRNTPWSMSRSKEISSGGMVSGVNILTDVAFVSGKRGTTGLEFMSRMRVDE